MSGNNDLQCATCGRYLALKAAQLTESDSWALGFAIGRLESDPECSHVCGVLRAIVKRLGGEG